MRLVLVVAAFMAVPGVGFAQDFDCKDFATQRAAQKVFEEAGPGDPHRLDRDHDGIACETLP